MKLDRLHIQGFKSFKERTTIEFDQGITGIVGPNGCGKSNIVDALFWVMGAQSAKHLRGKSMKDLIFAGSEKYAPASWAEVTLVLNNDQGKHIHIGSQVVKPTEIQLTRKLYRNGETEYRINGEPARLKDIQEVFMDTGAGAKSYAIIAQGEINRLIQAKPEERRNMIEDVAGITKFKMRRKESVKKLEYTEQNLNRLQDLQTEIYKNLKSLEKQAERANRAKSLQEKIERHELISESHKEFELLSQYVENTEKLETKTALIEELVTRKQAVEENLEEEREVKTVKSDQIETAQEEYNDKARDLAKAEQRVGFIQTNIEEKNKQYERRAHENGELLNDIEERTLKLKTLEAEFEEFQSKELNTEQLSELEDIVQTLKMDLDEAMSEVREKTLKKEGLKEEANLFFQKKQANSSKLEEYSRQLEDISLEIAELEKESSSFSESLLKERNQKEVLETKYNDKNIELNELNLKLSDARELFEKLNNEYSELRKEVSYQEATLKSLIDINAQFDQAFEATEELVKSDVEGFDLIGNIISSESEHSKVIETISRHMLKTIVYENDQSLENIVGWIKNNNSNGIEIAIPTTQNFDTSETIERLELKGFQGITDIKNLINVTNDAMKESVLKLFNGYLLVDSIDLEIAKTLKPELKFKAIIDKNSETLILNTGNAIFIHALNTTLKAEGMVARNNKIKSLTEDLAVKTEEFQELELNFNEAELNFKNLKQAQENCYQEFIDLKTEYTGLKSSFDAKQNIKSSGESKLNQLTMRSSELSQKRLSLIEEDETLEKSYANQGDILDELANEISDLEANILDQRSTYESKKDELTELQALSKTYSSQFSSYEAQINDNQSQIERYTDKLEQNREFQNALKEELENLEMELTSLKQDLDSQKEFLEEMKSELNEQKEGFADLLMGMQDRENEVRDLTQKINQLEKDSVEHKGRIEKAIENEEIVARNIFEKYQIDLRTSIGEFLELDNTDKLAGLMDLSAMFLMETEDGTVEIQKKSFTFVKKFPGEVRESKDKFKRYRSELSRLGEINWQAVQDYDRQKLRHDFLKAQEIELKKSLEDLEKAIEHIDHKSRERFKLAFNEVNERFMKVFPIIFGGGNARLEIIGHIDSQECGIDIVAQPPGKKMQSINLMSGGEKAMTAVSLIFSIFLVKPAPFCLLDEVDAPLDDANVGRFNELLREMSSESQFILITHNKKTMELNDTLYGVTMQEPGVSSAVSVQLH